MTELSPAARAIARSRVYAFLAQAFAEPDAETYAGLRQSLPDTRTALAAVEAEQSQAAIGAVSAELGEMDYDEFAAAHLAAFGPLASSDCPPYEGEYGHAHVFQQTQCLADNAGFIRAFGLTAAPGFGERIDHISVELEFLHVLAAKESYALSHDHGEERLEVVRSATQEYFEHHLGRWAPSFAARLEAKTQDGPYLALSRLLAAFLAEEASALGMEPGPAALVVSKPQADQEAETCGGCAAAFNSSTRVEP
jgi:DMSO reductase family type II enzyme chaperone